MTVGHCSHHGDSSSDRAWDDGDSRCRHPHGGMDRDRIADVVSGIGREARRGLPGSGPFRVTIGPNSNHRHCSHHYC